MLSINQFKRMAIIMMAVLTACTSEVISDLSDVSEEPSVAESQEGEIRHFSSPKEVVSAMDNYSIKTRSDDGFVSYLETVMEEPGYDDQPYAILSDAFGSILNSDGEVEFGDNLIKVTKYGLIYGSVSKRGIICELSEDETLLSRCKEKVWYAPLSNPNFYKIEGYDDLFFYDTFCFLNDSENSTKSFVTHSTVLADVQTGGMRVEERNSKDLFRYVLPNGQPKANWNKVFTVPSSGEQKQKFSNSRYCNDTKIYHQDFAIATDTGLKTKTMKKRKLGYWDKINGDMEAGIMSLSLMEESDFSKVGAFFINNVNFAGKNYIVVTEQSRGHSPKDILQQSKKLITSKINAAEQVAKENGVTIEVEAVRFVLDDKHAIILFPDKVIKKNTKKIEMDFRVPFGGSTTNGLGIMPVNSGPAVGNGEYYVYGVSMYGLTLRDNEIRGVRFDYVD